MEVPPAEGSTWEKDYNYLKEVMLDEDSILKQVLTVYAGMQHETARKKGDK